jgi:hypothetical protein
LRNGERGSRDAPKRLAGWYAELGQPRLMVVTANTCGGPRAYVGLAFSYGELITNGWQ